MIVVEGVWVVMLVMVSMKTDTEVWIDVLGVDCVSCNTPCSGLTIAIAKMSKTITATAMRDANASSSLSWRFK